MQRLVEFNRSLAKRKIYDGLGRVRRKKLYIGLHDVFCPASFVTLLLVEEAKIIKS